MVALAARRNESSVKNHWRTKRCQAEMLAGMCTESVKNWPQLAFVAKHWVLYRR